MDLKLRDKLILVGGASSGLGKGVAEALLDEGARVIGVARTEEKLQELESQYGDAFRPYPADLTDPDAVKRLLRDLANVDLYGALVNAGGPPAMPALETSLDDWDAAYQQVMRWKIQLVQGLLPQLQSRGVGRFVFVESVSTKQPVDNLVLSTAFRLGITGYVKTLAGEVAHAGVTFYILAPGYHATPRVDQLVQKSSSRSGKDPAEVVREITKNIPLGTMGDPADFGRLAAWLFSPYSSYLTGQTISVDGGVIRGTFG
jgi:3-oxoacyl-[acyl-carrier protein] reductase